METNNVVVKSKDELEIVSEVRQKWSRDNLVSDIAILEKQVSDIQAEILEKKELLALLDKVV